MNTTSLFLLLIVNRFEIVKSLKSLSWNSFDVTRKNKRAIFTVSINLTGPLSTNFKEFKTLSQMLQTSHSNQIMREDISSFCIASMTKEMSTQLNRHNQFPTPKLSHFSAVPASTIFYKSAAWSTRQ